MHTRPIPVLAALPLLALSLLISATALAGPIASSEAALTATITDIRNRNGGDLSDIEIFWTDFLNTPIEQSTGGGVTTATQSATPSDVLGVGDVIALDLASSARIAVSAGFADVANTLRGQLDITNFSFADTFEVDLQLVWSAAVSAAGGARPPSTARGFASLDLDSALLGVLIDEDLLALSESGMLDPPLSASDLFTLEITPDDFSDSVLFTLSVDASASGVPSPGTLGLLLAGGLGVAGRRWSRGRTGGLRQSATGSRPSAY
jgi:hypothetical protein